ncbi:hypothetical protein QM012_008908 [Aureobasidium pullulans]|uniref:GED domain-containing protein n=1 Tax=Aureobasidium pullulans TaxID=5580 RepID=A0ABR0THZ4_AURPU
MKHDDDMVAAYDVSTELPPDCPIYHSSFKIVTEKFDEILRLLREPFDESDYSDPNVEGLESLLRNRSKTRYPDEVRIALVGDMASGKSSLINSLLFVGVLARKGDTGTSCTWVIQEFRSTLPKQSTPSRAEIEYYSEAELEAVITFLFKEAYASLPSSETGSEALDDEFDNRSVSGLTAIKTIQALFCDRPECASEEAITGLLNEASSENDKDVIQKMIIWSRELVRRYAKQDDGLVSVVEHTTTQGLLQKLLSPWPLIKKITFGLDSPMLNDGVILMDLPGVHDSNSTRRRTVGKALAECTHYLVVAQIGRAQDDDTVTRFLGEGYIKKGSGRVIAAITNSDRIDGEMRNGNAEQQKQMEETKEKILSITGELDQIRAKRKTATREERFEIFEKEEELHGQLHDAESARESSKIMIRNKKTVKSLRRTYRYLTGDQRPLAIFCVSNKTYEQYQIGFERSDRPVLGLADTEIPKLRQHLRLATGEGRFNDAIFHYETQLPSLLTSVEIWCFRTHMKRRKEIEHIVLEPKEACEKAIQHLFTQVRANIETEILILSKQKEKQWNSEATDLCTTWAIEHNTRIFRSLLKGQGYRKGTKTKPEISWNSELTRVMAQNLSPSCDKILDLLTEMESAVALDFESPLSLIKEKVSADPEVVLLAMGRFLKKVEQQKPLMRNAVRECFRILRQNSIISECMEAVYQSAQAITGSNPHIRRQAKLLDGIVGDASLWMVVHARADERLSQMLDRRQLIFEKHVFSILTDIVVAFRASFCDKETEEAEESALRMQLIINLAKAKEVFEGPLKTAM